MSRTLTKVGITRATFRRLSRFAGAGKPFKQVTLVERGIRLVLEELESNSSHAQDSFRNPERAHQVGASMSAVEPAASTPSRSVSADQQAPVSADADVSIPLDEGSSPTVAR